MTKEIALESSIESTSQLLLQLFTLLNGYQCTSLQKVTIIASFFQIARCSILDDIEIKIELMGGKALTFKESLIETIYRGPLYASTIIFRIGSLCLDMAYLRYYSLIPMTILLAIQSSITWKRSNKMKGRSTKDSRTVQVGKNTVQVTNAMFLVVCNIGVVTAYVSDGVENEKDIVLFITHSTMASFLYHSAMLVLTMIIGRFSPSLIDHGFENRCEFPLEPGSQPFFWVLGSVLFMGLYSLTAIMYRAPSMAKVESSKRELKHDDEKIGKVFLKENDSDSISKP